jgi:hypothetical protein
MYEGLIQQMPVVLLDQWKCPTPSPNNDLELMEDIMQNGIQEPIILGVGVYSRQVRLDTGNHRIYLLPKLGMTHLPVVARVWNYCTFSNGNGDHSFLCPDISVKKQWLEEEYYAKPSDVLDIMQLLIKVKL